MSIRAFNSLFLYFRIHKVYLGPHINYLCLNFYWINDIDSLHNLSIIPLSLDFLFNDKGKLFDCNISIRILI